MSHAVGVVRRWVQHDPANVVRDVALTLVDGGDALRHMGGLACEPELFGDVGSAATACRRVAAIADDAESLAVAAATAGAHGADIDGDVDDGGLGEPVAIDLDAAISIASPPTSTCANSHCPACPACPHRRTPARVE